MIQTATKPEHYVPIDHSRRGAPAVSMTRRRSVSASSDAILAIVQLLETYVAICLSPSAGLNLFLRHQLEAENSFALIKIACA
jgi:hypothetical protein